ncbi:MAG: DUF883 family protein [Opitutaceae bacterium]
MSDSTSSLHDQAGHTVAELKALIREAESALSNVGAHASDEISDLRDRLRSAVAESKHTLAEAVAFARRQASHADELVRTNPYTSIGIATSLGVAIGYLLARCTCSRR